MADQDDLRAQILDATATHTERPHSCGGTYDHVDYGITREQLEALVALTREREAALIAQADEVAEMRRQVRDETLDEFEKLAGTIDSWRYLDKYVNRSEDACRAVGNAAGVVRAAVKRLREEGQDHD